MNLNDESNELYLMEKFSSKATKTKACPKPGLRVKVALQMHHTNPPRLSS